jgi:DNA-binding Lrp family transcriptional regulator
LLTRAQARRLEPAPPVAQRSDVAIEPTDQPLLDALVRDGRASYATLAKITGWSEGQVARRLSALRAAGALYLDIDLAAQLLGFSAMAHLWLTVAPADLARVGETIATHPEVGGVSAVTGTANLWAAVVCRDTDDLYRYVTTRIGAIAAVRELEISPTLRQVKYAGSILDGARLADPTPLPFRS